ncbi:MAG: hypothetical protein AAGF59_16350, partial [Pseudomonadota bacterium]
MRLDRAGLSLRGGFHPGPDDRVPKDTVVGRPGTVLLVGVVGGKAWETFHASAPDCPHPLDTWTRHVVDPVAEAVGGIAIHPNDRPFWPFQQWAKRSEPVFESPLGLLIHPEYGLWHAYRAAILVPDAWTLPFREGAQSPCETCADKPCLSTC